MSLSDSILYDKANRNFSKFVPNANIHSIRLISLKFVHTLHQIDLDVVAKLSYIEKVVLYINYHFYRLQNPAKVTLLNKERENE